MNSNRSILQSVKLSYRQGRSDKVYLVQLEQVEGGYVVNFQYGRRGSTLRAGAKTLNPVPLETARALYDRVVRSQLKDGYTEGTDGTPYSGTEKAGQISGLQPQLLNAIGEKHLQKYFDDPAYILQEKKDGNRLMVQGEQGDITGINRKGLLTAISRSIEAGVRELIGAGETILDGEAIGDVYYVFDLLALNGEDSRPLGYEQRWLRLQLLFGAREGGIVRLLPISRKPWHKRQRFEELRASGAEGVVFKKWDAPYIPGCPPSGGDQVKFKFVESATCRVVAVNGVKRSVRIQVEDRTSRTQVDVGSVTIPANFTVPEPGELVEIRYLYAFRGGSLFQPVYLGPRRDKDSADCVDTLKFRES